MTTELLTIMLSWNRPKLLEKTVRSYLATVTVPYRLIVVDNASDQDTVTCLQNLSRIYQFEVVYFKQNMGGNAFNPVLNREKGYSFVHFSENDLEYYPGWDKELLHKLHTFPHVGQISPYSPFPRFDIGQIMIRQKTAQRLERNGQTIYLAHNVGTTCIVRKDLIDRGLRWTSCPSKLGYQLPADAKFSLEVKKMGWQVAWNDKHLATNWGHNIAEFNNDIEYYIKNYQAKGIFPLFQTRLKEQGYQLVAGSDGRLRIEPFNQAQDQRE